MRASKIDAYFRPSLEESVAVMTREVEKLKAGDTDDLYAFLGMKKKRSKGLIQSARKKKL
ncbi:hypothetical protein TOC8172_12530 [Pseudomonas syringae]